MYFIFTTLVEVLDIWLPLGGYLIITVFMLLVAGILGCRLGVRTMKTVDPTPKKAIAEPRTP